MPPLKVPDKRAYQRPEVRVKRVGLESPVCAGSIEIASEQKQITISNQEVNTGFGGNNDFVNGPDTSWD